MAKAQAKKKEQEDLMPHHDVYYRVHPAGDGKPWVSSTSAWDLERFRTSLCKQYMEAKDGPHVVEFITKEEHDKEKRSGKRK